MHCVMNGYSLNRLIASPASSQPAPEPSPGYKYAPQASEQMAEPFQPHDW